MLIGVFGLGVQGGQWGVCGGWAVSGRITVMLLTRTADWTSGIIGRQGNGSQTYSPVQYISEK